MEGLREPMKALSQKTGELPNARRRQEYFLLCNEPKVVMKGYYRLQCWRRWVIVML